MIFFEIDRLARLWGADCAGEALTPAQFLLSSRANTAASARSTSAVTKGSVCR